MIVNQHPIYLMPKNISQFFGRIEAWDLYPPFLMRLIQTSEKLYNNNIYFYWTQGFRTFEEQDRLYAKGRTAPGGKVTKARGGWSAHNYRIAGDAVKDTYLEKDGLQPSWQKNYYKDLADAAISVGLEAGYYWKNFFDGPHIQLPLSKYGIEIRNLRKIHKKEGQEGVTRFLDQYEW